MRDVGEDELKVLKAVELCDRRDEGREKLT
jgi:hypothetical protein